MWMNIEEVKAKLYEVTSWFWKDGTVYFAETKMSAPKPPEVTLRFGDLTKTYHPIVEDNKDPDKIVRHWTGQTVMTVDVYTNGKPKGNNFINTAVNDLQEFVYWLESDEIIDELMMYNITLMPMNTGVRNLSELINDTKYRYRANMDIQVFFEEKTMGPYNMRGKTAPNASGGNKKEYVDATTDYFDHVEIKEDKSQ